jgi:hypothetical protein
MLQYHQENNVCNKTQKKKLILKQQCDDYTKEELLLKVAVLEAEKKILIENPQTINNQFNLIFPKAFGTEQIDNILAKVPNLLHDALTKHTNHSIEYLTEQIHCNKEVFPEYNNVYVKNYKSPFALVSNGTKFQNKLRTRIIGQIIANLIGMLQEYIDNNEDKYDQEIIDQYETYRDWVGDDSDKKNERRKDLEIDIMGLLLDMRPIIESVIIDKYEEPDELAVNDDDMNEYLYLLRVYSNNPDKIYKIGRTSRQFSDRYEEYKCTNPVIILVIKCIHSNVYETRILKKFRESFVERKDMGREYFTGNVMKMVTTIISNINVKNFRIVTNNCNI